MRVLLVEPYYGGSHKAWADGYAAHSQHAVEIVSMEPVFWKWRMQGGHVTMARRIEAVTTEPFDVMLVTSMTNVAALLGHARHLLGSIPVVLYMHENQLTYPLSPLDREDLTYSMINWTSMVAADAVVFNSAFHQDAWFAALPEFLGRFPDERHNQLLPEVAGRSRVLGVGVDLAPLDAVARSERSRPLVLWNQRWEYDKGPAQFAAAVTALLAEGLDFDVALAGERYGEEPPEFTELRRVLGDRLAHDGYAPIPEYRQLLRSANVVVSTARQEFFGIAITEAVYAGAFPVLPNRLVYPERIPEKYHEHCLVDDLPQLIDRLRWAINNRQATSRIAADLKPTMAQFDWREIAPKYDALLRETSDVRRQTSDSESSI